MPFKIDSYDGLALPEFLEKSDVQSMGTGRAASDYVQMAGGNFYDTYGDEDSPRLLTAISKNCVLYDTGGLSVREQVELLRAKLGRRGRLQALWHDGVTRWLWARLVSLDHARPFNARLMHLPVNVTFAPATGIWYDENDTVGGAAFTVTGTSADFVVTNPGNVDVDDVVIEYVNPFSGLVVITIENYATAQKIVLVPTGMEVGWSLVVDVGKRYVEIHELARAISSISRSGAVITVVTSGAHGYLGVGATLLIEGTTYDGRYRLATIVNTTTLELDADPIVAQPHGPQTGAGTILRVVPTFDSDFFSDKAAWMTLVPGANPIHVESSEDLDGGALYFTFYGAYA